MSNIAQHSVGTVHRKSAHGRTQLFLPTKGTILREVKCMGGGLQNNQAHLYHVLQPCNERSNICCWHCCEIIKNGEDSIPIPHMYDRAEGMFYVFGTTCSPECAKAYVIEHTSFNRGQHLHALGSMLREVYHIEREIVETPPRPALIRFGGIFDPVRTMKTECKIIQPPFISYCMIADECRHDTTLKPSVFNTPIPIEEANTFEEPIPPALFDTFIDEEN